MRASLRHLGRIEEDLVHAVTFLTAEPCDAKASAVRDACSLSRALEVAPADAPAAREVLVDLVVGADRDRALGRDPGTQRGRTQQAPPAELPESHRTHRGDDREREQQAGHDASRRSVGMLHVPERTVTTRVPGLCPGRAGVTSRPAARSRSRCASRSTTRYEIPQSRSGPRRSSGGGSLAANSKVTPPLRKKRRPTPREGNALSPPRRRPPRSPQKPMAQR